jgi:hypothetical protein
MKDHHLTVQREDQHQHHSHHSQKDDRSFLKDNKKENQKDSNLRGNKNEDQLSMSHQLPCSIVSQENRKKKLLNNQSVFVHNNHVNQNASVNLNVNQNASVNLNVNQNANVSQNVNQNANVDQLACKQLAADLHSANK